MTHPHHLHATRAAWALHHARTHLDRAVARDTADRQAEARTVAAASAIQAWRPVIGRGGGGHGDPASRAAVSTLEPDVRDGRLGHLAASTTSTLVWLADRLHLTHPGDPLTALTDAIPGLRPATCHHLWRWLDEADQRIRDRLGLDPHGRPLIGARCPRCARRQLVDHPEARAVTCTPECVCAGDTCPCQMPTPTTGAPHIWPADHPAITGQPTAA